MERESSGIRLAFFVLQGNFFENRKTGGMSNGEKERAGGKKSSVIYETYKKSKTKRGSREVTCEVDGERLCEGLLKVF